MMIVSRIFGVALMSGGGYMLFCGACALAGADWRFPCADAFSMCLSGQMVIVAGGVAFLCGLGLVAWRPAPPRQ